MPSCTHKGPNFHTKALGQELFLKQPYTFIQFYGAFTCTVRDEAVLNLENWVVR